MHSTWIDFKELRRAVPFEAVLRHYGVTVNKKRNSYHQGPCPLPTHQGPRGKPSFSAKLDCGAFRCFQCGASGDTIRFATIMEGLNPENPKDVRQVALKLRDTFGVKADGTSQPRKEEARSDKPAQQWQQAALSVVVNPPLDFELKNLDPEHPSLKGRGLYPETVREFGLGYCNRGYFSGRVAIPLHDDEGQLIGYAGEQVSEGQPDGSSPSILFPEDRERAGRRIRFDRRLFVYNAWRLKRPVTDLVVVTDLASVWWLAQCGYLDTVSLMGQSCSDEQARTICNLVTEEGRVWVFAEAPQRAVPEILARLASHRCVRWAKAAAGPPTSFTPGDIATVLWPA